jgi:hypothetical protein
MFSPDGRFSSYTQDETGRPEIHIQSFPGGRHVAGLVRGGDQALWRRDEKELFISRRTGG